MGFVKIMLNNNNNKNNVNFSLEGLEVGSWLTEQGAAWAKVACRLAAACRKNAQSLLHLAVIPASVVLNYQEQNPRWESWNARSER